ncbi:MAG: hypothetical protein HY287_12350 [Planctomycetes bacterium]|nr:hypothetical protein [Planctomycetota bacterium]
MLEKRNLGCFVIASILTVGLTAGSGRALGQVRILRPAGTPSPMPAGAKPDERAASPNAAETTATGTTTDSVSGTVRRGEVTANDVYVRSGDSMNHYTICKLSAGDHVTIVGEQGDWYEIKPPDGTFSLVSGDYIDTTNDKTGTVNGNNVRVRAGSTLNDNKYTVQTLLSKGTPVEIIGRNPDGFLRIKPPEGATLWVNKSFVSIGGSGASTSVKKAEPVARNPNPTAPNTSTETSGKTAANTPARLNERLSAASTSPMTGEWRTKLDELDALAKTEAQKPAKERNFAPIISRFQPIATQTEDDFAHQFAQRRIDEMNNMTTLTDAIKKVRELDDMSESQRREFLAARAKIPEPTVPVPSGLEVRGELRESSVYKPGSANTRYRLVDAESGGEHTAGYVEVPADVKININELLGHQVVVRASEIRPHNGAVEPIPIYVAREISLASER